MARRRLRGHCWRRVARRRGVRLRTACAADGIASEQQWYHRSVLDLLRGGRWLYVPHDQESYRVLPFEGLAPRGGSYWLHLEGDSTLLRGEKEELIWLMSAVAVAANTSRALGRPVREVLEQHAADIAAGRAPPSHHSIVNHLRVRCVAVGGNWTKARVLRAAQAHVVEKIGAYGNPKAQGVEKFKLAGQPLFVEIDAHGTEFHLSTGAAGGSKPAVAQDIRATTAMPTWRSATASTVLAADFGATSPMSSAR